MGDTTRLLFARKTIQVTGTALCLAVCGAAAHAQDSETGRPAASKQIAKDKAPSKDKTVSKDRTAAKDKTASKDKTPIKSGQYATEAAAQSGCRGSTVVWADKDSFNHYRGSREYGVKPGYFTCEK